MSPTAEHLLHKALLLDDADRIELVKALLSSFKPDDEIPFDESWVVEIARRSAEVTSGSVQTIPWEDVKRRARNPGVD